MSTANSIRNHLSPWFLGALLVQALLVVADIQSSETFTAVYVLPPLALALVDRTSRVAMLAGLACILALASGDWNGHFMSQGHILRVAIVVIGGALAVLSAQARTALGASRRDALAAQARAEATGRRLDAILGSLAEAVTVNDQTGRVVYANDAAVRLLDLDSVDELLSAEPGEIAARYIVTDEDGRTVRPEDLPGRQVVAGQEARPLLSRTVSRATGESHWYLTKATSFTDEHGHPHAVNVIEDITDAKEAELRQRFLAGATQVLASSLDYDETLDRIAWLAVPMFADWCGVDMVDGGSLARVALAHREPSKLEMGRLLSQEYPAELGTDTGLGAVIRTGRAEVYSEISDEMLVAGARDERHLELIRGLGMRSAMMVPMRVGGSTIGALTFVNADSARSFSEDDLAFAEDLAARAATAVENARLYTRLSATADTLQRSLLPERLEEPPGWQIAASYRAGERGSEVGGDFYDVFPVEDGWMVVLGDVTGKGVKAAALTALARHTAKTAARFDPHPTAVMRLLNEVLREQPELSLVTVVCAWLRPVGADVEVSVVSAGHPLPLRVRPDGEVAALGRYDLVLGAADGGSWTETTARLAPGETLLFYTDGVTDMPGAEDRFGDDRLFDTVAAGPNGAAELIARLDRALEEFQAGDLSDDRAMLALEWVGAARPAVLPR
jgi:PAS domain S-box-containing protein